MAEEHPGDLTRRALLARSAAAALPLVPADLAQVGATLRRPEALASYQRGMEAYRCYTPAANAQARAWFDTALRLDPSYVEAQAMRAATHRQDGNMAWTADRDASGGAGLAAGPGGRRPGPAGPRPRGAAYGAGTMGLGVGVSRRA